MPLLRGTRRQERNHVLSDGNRPNSDTRIMTSTRLYVDVLSPFVRALVPPRIDEAGRTPNRTIGSLDNQAFRMPSTVSFPASLFPTTGFRRSAGCAVCTRVALFLRKAFFRPASDHGAVSFGKNQRNHVLSDGNRPNSDTRIMTSTFVCRCALPVRSSSCATSNR